MNGRFKVLIAFITIGLVMFTQKYYSFESSKSEPTYQSENNNSESSINRTNDFYKPENSRNFCAECKRQCKKDKEMYSSGDAMSNYQPYYLCGNMQCVDRRYQKNLKVMEHDRNDREYQQYNRSQGY